MRGRWAQGVTVVLTHGFSSSGTMTLQNKQPTLKEAIDFLLKREPRGRLRKLGGSSTLLGKILFNIIWTRPLILTHIHVQRGHTRTHIRTGFLPAEALGEGVNSSCSLLSRQSEWIHRRGHTHTFRLSFKKQCGWPNDQWALIGLNYPHLHLSCDYLHVSHLGALTCPHSTHVWSSASVLTGRPIKQPPP